MRSISKFLLAIKLFSFMISVCVCAAPFYSNYDHPPCFIAAAIIFTIYLLLLKIDYKYDEKIKFQIALKKIYNDELIYMKGDHSIFGSGDRFINTKHEYSFDMDVFGQQSLFQRINRTVTKAGESLLAERLATLSDNKNEVISRQNAILELEEEVDFRFSYLAIGSNIDKELTLSIEYFQNAPMEKIFSTKYFLIASYLSIGIMALSSVTAYFKLTPLWIPFIIFLIQLIVPIILYNKTNKHAVQVGKLHKNMQGYSELINCIKHNYFSSELNKKLREKLFSPFDSTIAFKELSAILNKFDQRENAYVLILLNGFFLNDIFLLIKYSIWKTRYLNRLESWIAILAEFEVLISLANANFNNESYVVPEIIDQGDFIVDAKGLGHPFIAENKLITNDFKIRQSNFSIITGANMAGKSTLLRSLGINYIMALNGMKVCASSFNIQMIKLFSSMRNTDNLASGISYFNAELMRIEQLINYVSKNKNTLIILDEILKGTNSKDKLNGSIMFLQQIQKFSVSGIIATHDLALAELEETNPTIFVNYCFEIDLQGSSVYTYKMQKGICKNLNATYLLSNILQKIKK